MDILDYIIRRWDAIVQLIGQHMLLVVVSVSIAILIGTITGILITYKQRHADVVLGLCQVIMTIPSVAMLGLLLPFFGIGFTTGVITLILYSLLPIVRNTYSGINEISPEILEAAYGMGMTEWRILIKIKIPLALSVIMAGIRTAAVMVVGIGTIVAFIGAGGLGSLIFNGISRSNQTMIITGAIFVSIIAIIIDLVLRWSENYVAVE